MNHSRAAMLGRGPLRLVPVLVLALGGLALASGRARAAVLKPITISAPALSAPVRKIVGYGPATGAPIEQVTVRARVRFDPVILTTHSGVDLLHDDVADAARKACDAAGPFDGDEGCVRRAIASAQPQVTAAIARARSSEAG